MRQESSWKRTATVRYGIAASLSLEASDADEAVIRVRDIGIDLGLPGSDGFEVARRLRDTPELSRSRLLAVTGYAAPEDVARCKAAGFQEQGRTLPLGHLSRRFPDWPST